jgi:penicillin-binding protein 1C
MKNPLTIDSPIYDLAFTIGKDKPNNADGTFKGLMPIKLALAGSRNIPAIKMLMMAGGEGPIKQFLQKLGIVSLDMSPDHYGYPLAIGSAEIPE